MRLGKTRDAWRVLRGSHRAIPLCPGDQMCMVVTYHGKLVALRQDTSQRALARDTTYIAGLLADQLATEVDAVSSRPAPRCGC